MKNIRLILAALAIAIPSAGCATPSVQSDQGYLSEDDVINLMENPERWNGRTVTIRIFPYDNGFSESYVVCFEQCDEAYARSSVFLIYTRANRFRGYRGDRPVVVTARYDSSCFYTDAICPDLRAGQFTEITPPQTGN